ncbi:unnamed protein product [Brugia timori]|uniref:Uncharacterized protein n=1 Tax=Brugia timori TaxID=42155 RepID=A0A3P7WK97_9BILA|nr:unnamed protein product [Brugia timori]
MLFECLSKIFQLIQINLFFFSNCTCCTAQSLFVCSPFNA